MRVSVSLSDRGGDDWRDRGKCLELDAREFDDKGSAEAHDACRRCDVKTECRADCFQPKPHGVYRAGRYWPEKTIPDEAEECVGCMRPMIRSAHTRRPPEGAVRHQAHGRCETCDRRWRQGSTKTTRPMEQRLRELDDMLARGLDLDGAATAMGMKRSTLRDYLRRAGRTA